MDFNVDIDQSNADWAKRTDDTDGKDRDASKDGQQAGEEKTLSDSGAAQVPDSRRNHARDEH